MTSTLRTRLAPTPSGLLHPGNGLSFIITWAIARSQGGKIVLRIDDLDKERYRPNYVADIFRTLEWLGIDYDEGPTSVADFEQNWSQHQRLDHYHQALIQLKEADHLFPCQWSRKQIQALSTDGRYPYHQRPQDLSFNDPQTAWRVVAPHPAAQVSLQDWQKGKQDISLAPIDTFVVKCTDLLS
ncbi:MAG: glutamate--tRNA ligase family protein [Bacteroidota bacterium]